jgi:hypothetical protein
VQWGEGKRGGERGSWNGEIDHLLLLPLSFLLVLLPLLRFTFTLFPCFPVQFVPASQNLSKFGRLGLWLLWLQESNQPLASLSSYAAFFSFFPAQLFRVYLHHRIGRHPQPTTHYPSGICAAACSAYISSYPSSPIGSV